MARLTRPDGGDPVARPGALIACALALVLGVAAPPGAAGADVRVPARPPELDIRAPARLAPHAERLERTTPARLLAVMRLVGLEEPGPPIPVFLLPEDSPAAEVAPRWIAGYAVGSGFVVLFPERTPPYPYESMAELLQHEVAHVLINRAAGGRRVPRWFHEGVALAAERTWQLSDRALFAYEVAFGGQVPATSLDRLFAAGEGTQVRAYRLSGALVQDLREVHGADLPARVFAAMRAGHDFEDAFEQVTGRTIWEASDEFWGRRRLWAVWLPWLTSPGTLYAAMTGLALIAAVRVYFRRRARRAAEPEEELEDAPARPAGGDRPRDPPVTIH
jgi:hypothetical protein